MKLPCGNINSDFKYGLLGALVVAPLPAPAPSGGIVIDGGNWSLSNWDMAGWPVDWSRIAVNDVIAILTPTGSQHIKVTSVTVGASATAVVGTQNPPGYPPLSGFVDTGQITGVWLVTPAMWPCPGAPLLLAEDEVVEELPPPVYQEPVSV